MKDGRHATQEVSGEDEGFIKETLENYSDSEDEEVEVDMGESEGKGDTEEVSGDGRTAWGVVMATTRQF